MGYNYSYPTYNPTYTYPSWFQVHYAVVQKPPAPTLRPKSVKLPSKGKQKEAPAPRHSRFDRLRVSLEVRALGLGFTTYYTNPEACSFLFPVTLYEKPPSQLHT